MSHFGQAKQQRNRPIHFPRKRFIFLMLMFLAGAPAIAQNPSSAPASAGDEGRHKIKLGNNPVLASQIIAAGGNLVADYGSYQLYETPRIDPNWAGRGDVEVRDEYNVVTLNAGHLDTRNTEVRALRKAQGDFNGRRLHLVQFAGPVQPAWRDELLAAGVKIIAYAPENAYLVHGDAKSLAQLHALATNSPNIQWDAPYLDDYKIHPAARPLDAQGNPRKIGTDEFQVQLVDDAPANAATLQLLEQLKLAPVRHQWAMRGYVDLEVRLAPESLTLLAAQPDVIAILPNFPHAKQDERADQIIAGNLSGNVPSGPGYLAWLAGKGFTQAQFDASGFVVDVTDSGIDDGTNLPNHFGLYAGGSLTNASRVVYNRLEGTSNSDSTLSGCDGHGTLNAHIVGGYDDFSGFPFADSSGFHYGLGVCPFVRLGSSVIFDPVFFTSPDYGQLQSDAYQSGARISNNSWDSSGSAGMYDLQAQIYDALVRDAQSSVAGNQEMVIVFAAGNSGPGSMTVDTPGSAKNVITVGAEENVQAFGGADRGGTTDSQADSANDMVSFSGNGPCADGRLKPDLAAPGTHVSGGVPQAPNPGPDGTADPCFTGSGVSGGTDGPYFPDGQQFYTASSGTSQATPCVSGACALLRQYFINNFTNPPSPAMTKAYLMNSARYLTGAFANDTLWSDVQGMGGLDLGVAFDGTPRILRDELAADLFTSSGQTRMFTGMIDGTNQPFRVTLAWTDAPGSAFANAYNNNLDLTVTVGGNTYKGNVFSGAFSTTGGSADLKNNVESVFLPAGISGAFQVTIAGTSINSVGVPNSNNSNEQDFALVIYNGTAVAPPVISNISVNGTNVSISVTSLIGLNYTLQYKNLLSDPTWTPLLPTLPGNGGILVLQDTSAPQASRFYRVQCD